MYMYMYIYIIPCVILLADSHIVIIQMVIEMLYQNLYNICIHTFVFLGHKV